MANTNETNATNILPFKFDLVIKRNTTNMGGAVAKRKAVVHLRVLEHVKSGRVQRDINGLMCGDDFGSFYLDVAQGSNLSSVTCKKCLLRVQNWLK
ncbi:hypothetical protein AB4254_11875 [Vibrio breoganii]